MNSDKDLKPLIWAARSRSSFTSCGKRVSNLAVALRPDGIFSDRWYPGGRLFFDRSHHVWFVQMYGIFSDRWYPGGRLFFDRSHHVWFVQMYGYIPYTSRERPHAFGRKKGPGNGKNLVYPPTAPARLARRAGSRCLPRLRFVPRRNNCPWNREAGIRGRW